MNIILSRYYQDDDETLGMLHFAGDLVGYTLEDEQREYKVSGRTRIPAGKYEIVLQKNLTPLTEKYRSKYDWFKYHIMLKDVPGFSSIYMHIGNEGRDTHGCILVADQPSALSEDNRIIYSVRRFKIFYQLIFPKLLANDRIFIIVKNEKEVIKE